MTQDVFGTNTGNAHLDRFGFQCLPVRHRQLPPVGRYFHRDEIQTPDVCPRSEANRQTNAEHIVVLALVRVSRAIAAVRGLVDEYVFLRLRGIGGEQRPDLLIHRPTDGATSVIASARPIVEIFMASTCLLVRGTGIGQRVRRALQITNHQHVVFTAITIGIKAELAQQLIGVTHLQGR